MPNATAPTLPSDPRAGFARQAEVHNTLVWLHRYSGLAILLFLIFAGVSGSILVFRTPLDAALNPDLLAADTAHVTAAPAALADTVARAHPGWRITQAPLTIEPSRSLVLRVAPARGSKPLGYDEVFIDPQDGHVIGARQVTPGWGRRGLVEAIYQFHFNLLAGTFGRWFMGGGGDPVGAVESRRPLSDLSAQTAILEKLGPDVAPASQHAARTLLLGIAPRQRTVAIHWLSRSLDHIGRDELLR